MPPAPRIKRQALKAKVLSRSRGSSSTKIQLSTNGLGLPVAIVLTGGETDPRRQGLSSAEGRARPRPEYGSTPTGEGLTIVDGPSRPVTKTVSTGKWLNKGKKSIAIDFFPQQSLLCSGTQDPLTRSHFRSRSLPFHTLCGSVAQVERSLHSAGWLTVLSGRDANLKTQARPKIQGLARRIAEVAFRRTGIRVKFPSFA